MTVATEFSNLSSLAPDTYLVLGLSTCFIREDGEVHQVSIAEPIPSAALEAIVKGIPTSYQKAIGTTVGAMMNGNALHLPDAFPADTQLCDQFQERAIAAARTYEARPSAQSLVPLGTVREDFNYSLERKRVLNSERIVKVEDNVKQHAYTHEVL